MNLGPVPRCLGASATQRLSGSVAQRLSGLATESVDFSLRLLFRTVPLDLLPDSKNSACRADFSFTKLNLILRRSETSAGEAVTRFQ